MLNLKSILIVLILILAGLAALVTGSWLAHPSHAATATGPIGCHYQIAGMPPCSNKPVHIIPLTFTAHWSQQVAVPAGTWSFRYICDGASRVDQYDVLDETRGAWDTFVKLAPLTCDNQRHVERFTFRYAHVVVIGTSRPITGFVER